MLIIPAAAVLRTVSTGAMPTSARTRSMLARASSRGSDDKERSPLAKAETKEKLKLTHLVKSTFKQFGFFKYDGSLLESWNNNIILIGKLSIYYLIEIVCSENDK